MNVGTRERLNEERGTVMPIAIGDRLPDATFAVASPGGPSPATTNEVFAGKTVVLFAVPGAFTPTCSNQHLPSYLRNYDAVKTAGVDTIACVAVNDPFVLAAWAEQTGAAGRILMLSDGNATFTRAIGLEMDSTRFGMGIRSKRYAMVVKDGVVTELNVDNPGEYKVSSAEFTCKL
jgi:peroxiredoxin